MRIQYFHANFSYCSCRLLVDGCFSLADRKMAEYEEDFSVESPASAISLEYNNQPLQDTHPAPPGSAEVGGKKRKLKKEPFAWKDEVVQFMIDRWQEEPVLFNIKDPYYHDKTRRSNAVERILMAMEKNRFHPRPTVEQLQEKMHSLRCYYNTQHNKVKSSKNQTGQGADAVYKPRWQFYDSLSFLQDMVAPRRTVSNMDTLPELTSDSLLDDLPAHEKKVSKKKALPSAIEESMMAASSALKVISERSATQPSLPAVPVTPPATKSLDDIFGEAWAKLMTEIPEGYEKDMLRIEVQRTICQGKHAISIGPAIAPPYQANNHQAASHPQSHQMHTPGQSTSFTPGPSTSFAAQISDQRASYIPRNIMTSPVIPYFNNQDGSS